MGTQVPRALISTLLIAGVFYAPLAPLAHADEQVASSTEATTASTTVSVIVATTTQENVIAAATTTAHVSATVPDQGPSFVDSIVSHPNHVLRASNSSEQQTALKDGDVVDIAAVVTGAVPASAVTVDVTGLDGSTVLNLSCDPSYTNSSYPHPLQYCRGTTITVNSGGRTGTTSVVFTATDEAGLTVTKSVDIVFDQLSPVFSNPTLARTSTSTFSRDETLHFSGTLNGTGSGAKIYSILGEGLSADGNIILYGSYYNWNHPLLSDVYAIRAGTFSNVSLPLSGASSGADIPSDVASMRFVFTIEDDAGHISYATSTVSATSTTPSGPQVSNVLFLPGIKGSRLYSDEVRCGVIGCDNKLWDPLSNSDVQDLYLDGSGRSIRNDVYTKPGDIVDKVDKKYYDSFIKEMDSLQASTTFSGGNFKWKAAAYDWRLSLNDIINNGVEREGNIYYEEASSTPYIEQTLRQLAQTSTTGKVTIIAHSNGGLVTKALLLKLGEAETAALVDKIIFVGVPQTGAPQALGALLFGDHEGLPNDNLPLLVSRGTARSLAENSPMAYHLMPSNKYLHDTQDPTHAILSFTGSVLFPKERAAYGTSIDTITELDNFLLATESGRVKPATQDIDLANILNSWLIDYANTTHASLDAWIPPASVSLYQIAGWGANTISGIDLYDEQKLIGLSLSHKRQYRLSFIEDGDGVVPIPSALTISTSTPNIQRLWIDLKSISVRDKEKFDHGNIFETSSLLMTLQNILNNQNSLPSYVTSTQPLPADPDKKLIFQLHSPLTLGIFDMNGKHTGLNKDGTVTEEIPGTEYGEMGGVKYIIAPANQTYSLIMNGLDEGRFSLDIQEQSGNNITSSATIADVPTTPRTIARLTIKNDLNSVSDLAVDSDGDGDPEISILPVIGETTMYREAVYRDNRIPNSRHSSLVIAPIFHAASSTVRNQNTPMSPIAPSITKERKIVQAIDPDAMSTKFIQLTHNDSPSQTAAAYSAFHPLAKWFQLMMYNTWKLLMSMFKNILNF